MKVKWNAISGGDEEFPVIHFDNGDELHFDDFEEYRSFVMTLVGDISATDKLPYDIILKPKE